jgi:hypothetical protein
VIHWGLAAISSELSADRVVTFAPRRSAKSLPIAPSKAMAEMPCSEVAFALLSHRQTYLPISFGKHGVAQRCFADEKYFIPRQMAPANVVAPSWD